MAIVRKSGGSGGGPAKILIADRVPNPRDLTSVWQPGDGFYPLNDQTFPDLTDQDFPYTNFGGWQCC